MSIYRKSVTFGQNYFFCEEQTLYGSARLGTEQVEHSMRGLVSSDALTDEIIRAREQHGDDWQQRLNEQYEGRFYERLQDAWGNEWSTRLDLVLQGNNDGWLIEQIRNESYTLQAGTKRYELSNHLGNVLAVVSDKKVQTDGVVWQAEVVSAQDYFPFGMAMPARSTDVKHRYTFNGKETDPETGIQDYGMRWYLPNIARFPSVDPLTKKYPFYTPYAFAGNTPIRAIDLDGAETLEQVGVFPVYGQIECPIIRKRSNGFRGVAEGHISIELDDRREFALWRGRMTNGTTVLSLRTDFDVNTDAGIPNPNDPTQLNKLSYTDAAKKLGITLNPTEEVHFAVPGTDDSGIGNQLYRGGVDLGDLGVAFKMGANGNIEACAIGIITDHGPAKMTGEGSPKANSTLGLPTHHFKGGSSTNNINMHLFAGSAKYWKKHIGGKDADGKPLTNQQIYEAGFNDMMKEMIDSSDPKLNSMLLKLNNELNKEKTYKEYDNIPPPNK